MPDPTPNVPARSLRREYARGELLEPDALPDPIEQFRSWFDFATESGVAEPNAMTLATATRDGIPSARIVLLKEVPAGQECGMAFANYQDIRQGDVIECFNVETVTRTL